MLKGKKFDAFTLYNRKGCFRAYGFNRTIMELK